MSPFPQNIQPKLSECVHWIFGTCKRGASIGLNGVGTLLQASSCSFSFQCLPNLYRMGVLVLQLCPRSRGCPLREKLTVTTTLVPLPLFTTRKSGKGDDRRRHAWTKSTRPTFSEWVLTLREENSLMGMTYNPFKVLLFMTLWMRNNFLFRMFFPNSLLSSLSSRN